MKPDFSGYATKYGLKCSDGRTIMPSAFLHHDNTRLPLVWKHDDTSVSNVLGHVQLEHREDGVYAYGFFNKSKSGQDAKAAVHHKDIDSLSIKARRLVQDGLNVKHGQLTEVSLVPSGANPGARVDNIYLEHSDGTIQELEDEAIIYTGLTLEHEDKSEGKPKEDSSGGEKTIKDVFDSLTKEQKDVVYFLIGQASEGEGVKHEDSDEDDDETMEHNQEGDQMSRNLFDQTKDKSDTLTHELTDEQVAMIFSDAERIGSLKESVLAHADQYGITDIDLLFPDAKAIRNTPEWIKRDDTWVRGLLNGVHTTPFSRVKSLSADLTHEEARAKGYIKGNLKKDQFFKVSKRETTSKTIYKKQKLDRDDITDIQDLDVVAWMKQEMRFMLEEELARAILIGDGRDPGDEDKINEENIRPIAKDDDFYSHKVEVPSSITPKGLINAVLRSRRYYKGTSPTFYTTEDVITDLLLDEDRNGRRYHKTLEELAATLRVTKIVPVEVMEDEPEILGILVNISDYTLGTNRGGETTMFEDFDIDYNQHKYLIETRVSGALTRHKRAVVFTRATGTQVVPTIPTRDGNDITIPTVTGVIYTADGDPVTGEITLEEGESVNIQAEADEGYYFPLNIDTSWNFSYQE